jgi:hypothetical protein
MNRSNTSQPPLTLESQLDEDRVRRALGLKTNGATHQQRPEQARQRHRFVSDGAVPVVMLNRADGEGGGLKERLTSLEAALESERAAHAATRRALQEANASNQALQTRLGHAGLAHTEALEAERAARRAAEEVLAAVRAELAEAPQKRVEPEAEPVAAKPERAVGRPRVAKVAKEQKPVRWWTPSYRAKRKS